MKHRKYKIQITSHYELFR